MKTLIRLAAILLVATSLPAGAAVDKGVRDRVAALSVPFVANSGQWDPRAAFAAPIFAGTLFVTRDGKLVYRLAPSSGPRHVNPAADGLEGSAVPVTSRDFSQRVPTRSASWVLTESLVDADGTAVSAKPVGAGREPGSVSYLIGQDESRHADALATYDRVDLGEVYPGIGMHVRATGSNVEKIFVVAPGANPASIRLRVDGAQGMRVGQRGDLIVETGNGDVSYTAPIAYQESNGARSKVSVSYALDTAASGYRFALGEYDATLPLVIDPLLQSTYLGGNGFDVAAGVAIHPTTGDVYVVGTTISSDFPNAAGAEQVGNAGLYDVFVTRLNAALTARIQSTYIGGSGDDFGNALTIHPASGEVYIAGSTTSADFPKVAGSEQVAKAPMTDGFVIRLNAALTSRLQATYLGGGDNDIATSIAIHPVSGRGVCRRPDRVVRLPQGRRIGAGGQRCRKRRFRHSPQCRAHLAPAVDLCRRGRQRRCRHPGDPSGHRGGLHRRLDVVHRSAEGRGLGAVGQRREFRRLRHAAQRRAHVAPAVDLPRRQRRAIRSMTWPSIQ